MLGTLGEWQVCAGKVTGVSCVQRCWQGEISAAVQMLVGREVNDRAKRQLGRVEVG